MCLSATVSLCDLPRSSLAAPTYALPSGGDKSPHSRVVVAPLAASSASYSAVELTRPTLARTER